MKTLKNFIKKTIKEIVDTETLPQLNENFYKWFGNSKVVDKNGNPMICYHGTGKGGFEVFQPKIGYTTKPKQQVDLGSHFSIDKEYAKEYAKGKKPKVYECFLKIENPLLTNTVFWLEDGEEQFIKILNFVKETFKIKLGGDYYYDKKGEKHKGLQNIMVNSFLVDKISSRRLYDSLIKHGFDGVFHEPYNMEGLHQFKKHPKAYIVLYPNQIKSINNDGSWDLNDDNIYS